VACEPEQFLQMTVDLDLCCSFLYAFAVLTFAILFVLQFFCVLLVFFCVIFLALVSQQQCSQLLGIKNDQLSVQININSPQSLSRKKLFILSTHTQSKWESGMGFFAACNALPVTHQQFQSSEGTQITTSNQAKPPIHFHPPPNLGEKGCCSFCAMGLITQ